MTRRNRAVRSLVATVFLKVVSGLLLLLGAWLLVSLLWSYPRLLLYTLFLRVLISLFFVNRYFLELFREIATTAPLQLALPHIVGLALIVVVGISSPQKVYA